MPQIITRDEIVFKALVDDVWRILIDIPNYPLWWPKAVNLKILHFNSEIIGTEFRANPLGGKSFACRVTGVIPNKEMKLDYYEGIYKGTGFWKIESNNDLVKVSYTVDLEIVDKSIALLSKIISIPKLHSMIFNKILSNLKRQILNFK